MIVITFTLLNLPRIVASTLEVTNTNLIIYCVENELRYVPSLNFYKLDFFARLFMVVNSALNFIIYCAVSTPFQVKFFCILIQPYNLVQNEIQEAFLECLCPCYTWLKPWLCGSQSPTPQTEEDEELEDEDNAANDHQLEELQRRLSRGHEMPSMAKADDDESDDNHSNPSSDKITVIVNNHVIPEGIFFFKKSNRLSKIELEVSQQLLQMQASHDSNLFVKREHIKAF